MFRIVICDDKKENIDRLNIFIRRIIKSMGIAGVEVFSAAPDALYKYNINDNYTYLFILDVIYKDINGIEIARKLRGQYKDIYIVFITGHIELMHMVINQNIMPSGFLSKPVSENDIRMVLLEIFEYSKGGSKTAVDTLTVNTGSVVYKIRHNEIIFIESLNKKIYIYTETRRISCYGSLYGLMEELGEGFIRCHKSYIINKAKIKNIFMAQMYIEMSNGNRVAMSRTYKNAVREIIKE